MTFCCYGSRRPYEATRATLELTWSMGYGVVRAAPEPLCDIALLVAELERSIDSGARLRILERTGVEHHVVGTSAAAGVRVK